MPGLGGTRVVLLAVGIMGATVMPHVIYLHSALTQNRIVPRVPRGRESADALHADRRARGDDDRDADQRVDAHHGGEHLLKSGFTDVASLEDAHKTLEPILGATASAVFAVALLGSGLSSSAVGTYAGQVVMQGFVQRQIPLWLRRTITMVPAFVVVALGVNPSRTLVLSQVVLSFGIPFALVPLVWFTSRRDLSAPSAAKRD